MTPHIEAEGLTVSRGERVVLSELEFSFRAGEMVAVIGLNGAAKARCSKPSRAC